MDSSETGKKTRRLNLPDRLMLRLFDVHRTFDAIEIFCNQEREFQRIAEALRTISTFDPLRHKRLVRDIDRIVVQVLVLSTAQYAARIVACELDPRYVLSDATTTADLASAIVHEATHARLENLGIKYLEKRRAKIEDVCLRRELAFLLRVPDGSAKRRSEIERTLAQMPSLTDESFQQRAEEGSADALAYLGMPRRLIGPVLSLFYPLRRLRRILRW